MDEGKYLQIIEDLKKTVNVFLEGFYDLKEEANKFKKKVDLSKQFSIINLPSNGIYYPGKNKSILIKYLTAVEEHVLCDYMLMESGKGIELVLSELIMDDINIRELLLGDFQAILMFLRSTAYGDTIDINTTCPYCGKKDENKLSFSQLEFKEPKEKPNEEGKYIIFFPDIKTEFVISPMTLEKELKKVDDQNEDDYFILKNDEGTFTKIRKERSISLAYSIDSINGIKEKNQIKKIIRNLPKKYVDSITDFIKENELGIDETVKLKCQSCGEDFEQKIYVGYNFLSLPENYKQNIYEEMFLITYYGKGITRADAMSMPVVERKWHIRRIKEELEKQSEAEKAAMRKAKGSKGKF